MDEPIQVQEKTPRPQGLLPKNVQSWILAGLAFLMVAIMWLTGGKKPQSPTKAASAAAPVPAPLEVNETKIAELQSRIEELQRQQLVAQSALAQQTHLLGAAQDPPSSSQPNAPGDQPPEDPIEAERKTRAYASLFASNVALTYRPTSAGTSVSGSPSSVAAPAAASPASDLPELAQILKEMQPNLNPPAPTASAPRPNSSAETKNERKEDAGNPAAVEAGASNAAAGKTYVIFEGTILETVLINRLDRSLRRRRDHDQHRLALRDDHDQYERLSP
jgi:type IV secretion system protein VirB10